MISAFGVVHKSWVPSLKAHKYADQLSSLQRREVGMGLKSKHAAAKTTNQALPGFAGGSKKSRSAHYARLAHKEVERSKRIRRGEQVSPVKRRSS